MKIEPGPELDRAIAEAIGWPNLRCAFVHYGDGGYEGALFRCSRCGDVVWDDIGGPDQPCVPSYSADLTAAFAAAEKVGLFDGGDLEKAGDVWLFDHPDTGFSRGPTPALAICAAILKLRGPKSTDG